MAQGYLAGSTVSWLLRHYSISLPLNWWRAQCAFRDIPVSGSIAVLQGRIRDYGPQNGIARRIAVLRDELQEKYNKKNREKIDEVWRKYDHSEKARLWPKRWIHESFIDPTTAVDAGVILEVEIVSYTVSLRNVVREYDNLYYEELRRSFDSHMVAVVD